MWLNPAWRRHPEKLLKVRERSRGLPGPSVWLQLGPRGRCCTFHVCHSQPCGRAPHGPAHSCFRTPVGVRSDCGQVGGEPCCLRGGGPGRGGFSTRLVHLSEARLLGESRSRVWFVSLGRDEWRAHRPPTTRPAARSSARPPPGPPPTHRPAPQPSSQPTPQPSAGPHVPAGPLCSATRTTSARRCSRFILFLESVW